MPIFTVNKIEHKNQAKKTSAITSVQQEKVKETLTTIWKHEELIEDIVKETNSPIPLQTRTQPSSEHPEINFDNTESDQETIIDIRAKDKLGLLYAISTTLYELGLNISLDKVTTQAMMAIDSFYISDKNGKKIRDGTIIEEIQHKLTEKLIG